MGKKYLVNFENVYIGKTWNFIVFLTLKTMCFLNITKKFFLTFFHVFLISYILVKHEKISFFWTLKSTCFIDITKIFFNFFFLNNIVQVKIDKTNGYTLFCRH